MFVGTFKVGNQFKNVNDMNQICRDLKSCKSQLKVVCIIESPALSRLLHIFMSETKYSNRHVVYTITRASVIETSYFCY